jgi:hypothetical protein
VRWCRHDAPDAHDIIYKHITILMNKLVAARWFLKELEPVALEWLAAQFKGRAADYWQRIVGVARVTATTSGIGHNSVLYRCLRDMLLAYLAFRYLVTSQGVRLNLPSHPPNPGVASPWILTFYTTPPCRPLTQINPFSWISTAFAP